MTASALSAPSSGAPLLSGRRDTPHPESDDTNDTGGVGVRPPSASVPPAPEFPGGFPLPAFPEVLPPAPPNPELPDGGGGQFGGGKGQPWVVFQAASCV